MIYTWNKRPASPKYSASPLHTRWTGSASSISTICPSWSSLSKDICKYNNLLLMFKCQPCIVLGEKKDTHEQVRAAYVNSPSMDTSAAQFNRGNIPINYNHIIINSFYSLRSIGHPRRACRHCGLQLSPWPRSTIFLFFLSHPLFSFAMFSSAYLPFYKLHP